MTTTDEVRIALDAKRDAERQLAAAANCPPWRHGVFGLLMGALVASPGLDTVPRFVLLGLILLAIPLIIRSDRKRLGMFVNGYRRGKTRWVAFGILAVMLPLYALSVHQGLDKHDHITPLLLGLVMLPIGIAGSLLWQRVFARELGA